MMLGGGEILPEITSITFRLSCAVERGRAFCGRTLRTKRAEAIGRPRMALSERAAEYNNRKFTPETRRVQDEAGLDFHPRLRVGTQAPDFTAYQLDGATVRLS